MPSAKSTIWTTALTDIGLSRSALRATLLESGAHDVSDRQDQWRALQHL